NSIASACYKIFISTIAPKQQAAETIRLTNINPVIKSGTAISLDKNFAKRDGGATLKLSNCL
ncbi:hypothetical protein, partial [Candidatus Kuenenia stuttgartiensis]|uniref:hypothetical protein n=1 Tax=Kuenenia stuttgartiensis TaxID=174633 RepID=UPI001B8D2BE6